MRVVFSPEARQEFEEAERYYERQVPGLGARFARKFVLRCHESEPGRYPVHASAATYGA